MIHISEVSFKENVKKKKNFKKKILLKKTIIKILFLLGLQPTEHHSFTREPAAVKVKYLQK